MIDHLQNTYGSGAKAVALRVSGDRAAFYGCRILSHQDTLLDDTGRHYYRSCYIEGDTDFICGDAASLFEVTLSIYIIRLPIYFRS
jgi:pectinesterase